MSFIHIIYLVGISFVLAISQSLLKQAVIKASLVYNKGVDIHWFFQLLFIWQFWLCIIFSFLLMGAWTYILRIVPLSKAYPFIVLAFVFVGIFEHFFWGVQLSWLFFLGCGLICLGLLCIMYN